MKIIYLTNVRIPTTRAQGYAVMKMCEAFSQSGNELKLYIPKRRDVDNLGDPFKYYGVERKFIIKTILHPDLLSQTYILGKFFYWLDILWFLIGLRLTVWPKTGEIIYTRDYLIALLFSKKNFICLELHDLPRSKFLFRLAIRKPKLFVVLNNYLKQELINLGVSRSIIQIAPSGIDLKDFNDLPSKEEARKELGLPIRQKIVFYGGQFYPWKGIETLAKAQPLVLGATFIFLGGTEPELSEFRNRYNKAEIMVKEFLPRQNVLKYLAAADILVLPNSAKDKISTHYTSPLKLFEYMAVKRPIVASDLLSLREVLSENNCFFAKPDNPESFAEAINKLLTDDNLGERLAGEAYKDIQNYTWTKRAKGIIDVIVSRQIHD